MLDQKFIDANVKNLRAEVEPEIARLIGEAVGLVRAPGAPLERFESIVSIAERLSQVIAPYTPCRSGCNHCCHMAVAVTRIEADAIGRYLGKDLAVTGTQHEYIDRHPEDVKKYTGVPCTLLDAQGKCSVYPVRPIACRTHHNLAPDSNNCKLNVEEPEMTVSINLIGVNVAAVDIGLQEMNTTFADIREFFPKDVK